MNPIPVILSNILAIPVTIPTKLWHEAKDRLTFPNPKWEENAKYGYWQGDTERLIECWEADNQYYYLPRAFIPQLISMIKQHGLTYQLIDQGRTLVPVSFTFTGQLKPFQEKAVKEILTKDFTTLSAPTGSGKTVIALYVIALRQQPALVIVHTKELLYQWIKRIETFLAIAKEEVGQIGDNKFAIGNRITVAIINSLYPRADEVKEHIGFLVIDECHRTPARTFTEAIKVFDCKYMLGLSATPYRRDKLSKLIYYYVGSIHHQIDQKELEDKKVILRPEVIIKETSFDYPYYGPEDYQDMLRSLVTDTERNRLIVEDMANEIKNTSNSKYTLLALSDRKEHCYLLQRYLRDKGIPSTVLVGDLPKKQRQEIVSDLNNGEIKVLLATGQLIGEGFDSKRLSKLFLCTPIKFTGRVKQYLGRILRTDRGKKAKIYDYLDAQVGVLKASFQSRQRVYCGKDSLSNG